MIVACPSCSTRYRHNLDVPVVSEQAHCSSCDVEFALEPIRRSYVLLPSSAFPDTWATQRAAPAGAQAGLSTELGPDALMQTGRSTGSSPVAGPWLDFVVALVPSSVGAFLAYSFAGQQQVDPVTWTALGGAAGLLLGWGCLLWIRRKD